MDIRNPKTLRKTLAVVGILTVLFIYFGYFHVGSPRHYSAEAIEAWVVDAETQEPLEGVIAVAMWILRGGTHNDEVGFLEVLEVVTDAKGRFYFDAWGPMPRPRWGVLNTQDPEIFLFKDGYRFERLLNGYQGGTTTADRVRTSTWNGKTIPLERFEGEIKEYARSLSYLSQRIDLMAHKSLPHWSCEWEKIPRLMLAVEKVEMWRKLTNPRSLMGLITTQDIVPAEICRSVDEIFKKYRS